MEGVKIVTFYVPDSRPTPSAFSALVLGFFSLDFFGRSGLSPLRRSLLMLWTSVGQIKFRLLCRPLLEKPSKYTFTLLTAPNPVDPKDSGEGRE